MTDAAPTAAKAGRLRIVLCTRGGLFGALVLHRLRACGQVEICGIVRSSRVFQPEFGFLRGALAYVRRSGIAYALYLFCATTLTDMLCRYSRMGCVPRRTRHPDLPVHETRDINAPRSLRFLSDCAPDLLVSAFFDQRLREAALAVPARGCVNIHPSLLPWFKGVDPVLQTQVQGGGFGVSVHYMSPRLDAGEILAQRTAVIRQGASIFEATAALFRDGAELLVTEIGRLAGLQRGSAQSGPGSYQSWPDRAAIRTLRTRGGALIRLADFRRLMQPRRGSAQSGCTPGRS